MNNDNSNNLEFHRDRSTFWARIGGAALVGAFLTGRDAIENVGGYRPAEIVIGSLATAAAIGSGLIGYYHHRVANSLDAETVDAIAPVEYTDYLDETATVK